MTSPMPARPGDALPEIDTPALLVDLDALDANIALMAARARAAGVALRPHGKTHKSVAIARRQLAAGAVGLCCQKVSEAEALLPSGVEDLLVSNHVVGARKLERLAALAGKVRVTTLASDIGHVGMLSAAAVAAGVTIDILIEIDAGDARMGLQSSDALLPLAEAIHGAAGLRLRGIQAYNGPMQHVRGAAERARAAHEAGERAAEARARIRAAGLPCPLVTGGGTGSFEADLASGLLNEIQPGSYVFMDVDYARNLDADGAPYRPFAQSLFVLAGVLRTPAPGLAYVDAGAKALNLDCGPPAVADRPELAFTKASDEQGRIEAAEGAAAPVLGERLRLVPSHCDPNVALYDWMVAVRGDLVEAVWPVDGRGCLT
ncbi:DSD1 family PLP-dependent enzyme [Aquabacter sediminis]|uniref:DSD1 family PLP-dependent enzyme n=1 Tax=Aquabacter sediminis TaxID=3029197 RepID=UPI00237EB723|nr:DSD1 family PLP-dependent enzyme [Aquabacter sp. P-9]MDE1569835.1 DSD1 family PLP-dependent enzyme [Aquabacter sp. P-9]